MTVYDRGERVRHAKRVKDKMRRIWRGWGLKDPHPRWIGVMASTHGKPCSCAGCGNLRRYVGPTLQELRAPPAVLPEWYEFDLYDTPDDPPWWDWEYGCDDAGVALAIFKSQDTRPLRVPLLEALTWRP